MTPDQLSQYIGKKVVVTLNEGDTCKGRLQYEAGEYYLDLLVTSEVVWGQLSLPEGSVVKVEEVWV